MTGARRTPRPTNSAEKVARIADVFNIATGEPDGLEGNNGDHTKPEAVDDYGYILEDDDGTPPDPGPAGPDDITADADEIGSWQPVDLRPYLLGVDVPPPVVLARTDGLHLLYAGKTHVFIGESESCKTWGACLAAAEVLQAGGRVLWIDYEDEPGTLTNRLHKALGLDIDLIANGVDYMNPDSPLRVGEKYTAAGVYFHGLIKANAYTLAVVDGVTEAMTTEGLDPLGTNDAAIWARRLTKPIAATGAAVVVLDHVPKGNGDGPTRYALGSQHKISGLTGAGYIFEVRKTLHRATTDPVHGEVIIKVSKDRPGHVRAGAIGFDRVKTIAIMELNAYPDGGITGRLLPPDEVTTTPPAKLLEAIAAHLSIYPGVSGRNVWQTIGGREDTVREVLAYMVRAGHVSVEKKGVSHLHTLTPAGLDLLPK